jgi:glycosyltransferase involved in cell wall biosynthesis
LKQLSPHSYMLNIVGDPSINPTYARNIQDQIDSSSLTQNIQMSGSLSDDQLAKLLRVSHVVVVPSSYEGFGIVYLEGMSFGLPAIATTRGAAREIIDHGVNGYLIPSGDVNALALVLQEVVANRKLLEQLSLAARQRFLANPTWEQTANSIRDFMCDLVNS